MYWVPRQVARLWNVKSIYMTENGTSGSDQPAADGIVYDVDRIQVSAKLSGAAAARDIRGRAHIGIFSVESGGQFRVGGRI
jgi:hypothetical protein